jgi:hypothetical protein
MAAVLTGTPVAVTWAAGANPAGQSITIPADATAVYMFWSFYTSADGNGLASVTLNGASPNQTFEIPTAATDQTGTGVAAWYNPATGSRTLDPAWDAAPEEGSTCIVVFTKDGDTTAWRDADADNQDGAAACSVTLTTVSGDLVLKFDQSFSAVPSLSSGWTAGQTHSNNSEGARLSYISATGTTQVCASEDENYSSVCAISIPASSGSDATVSGQTLTATASLIDGAVTASGSVAGQTLTVTASLIAGAATVSAAAAAQTLTATASLVNGAVSAGGSVDGQVMQVDASLIAGSATGTGDATVAGQILTAAAALVAGAVEFGNTVVGQVLSVTASLLSGGASSSSEASAVDFLTRWRRRGRR